MAFWTPLRSQWYQKPVTNATRWIEDTFSKPTIVMNDLDLLEDAKIMYTPDELGSSPAVAQATEGWIRTIAWKPFAELTLDDVHRMAFIENLPPGLKPDLPEVGHSFGGLAYSGKMPDPNNERSSSIRSYRSWITKRDLVNDPGATPDTVQKLLEDILNKPAIDLADLDVALAVTKLPERLQPTALSDEARREIDATLGRISVTAEQHLTTDDYRRLEIIERLPKAMRPNMPSMRHVVNYADTSIRTDAWNHSWSAFRQYVGLSTEAGQHAVREKLASGEPLDPSVIASLLDNADLAAKVGASTGVLQAQIMDHLGRLSTMKYTHATKQNAEDMLRRTAASLDTSSHDPTVVQLTDEARSLLLSNADRAAQSRYVDYAEIAKAVANVELVRMLDEGASLPASVQTW